MNNWKERKIIIEFNNLSFEGLLNDSNTSNLIWDSLPINSSVSTWGDEIYFSIPVNEEEEDAKEVVEIGSINGGLDALKQVNPGESVKISRKH